MASQQTGRDLQGLDMKAAALHAPGDPLETRWMGDPRAYRLSAQAPSGRSEAAPEVAREAIHRAPQQMNVAPHSIREAHYGVIGIIGIEAQGGRDQNV